MLLKRLTEACGGPGQEKEVRDLIKQEVASLGHVSTDALGNLLVKKDDNKKGPKVMLAAHMDEVSLMVMGIEKSGMLKIRPVGGIDPRVLVAKTVLVGPKKVPGVLGSKPIHLQKPQERERPLGYDQLFIDLGVKNKEEAERLVSVGDHAYFSTSYQEIGKDKISAKALDDRVGCAMLIEVLKDNYDFPLYGAFTVQEEVGLRGAGVAAYSIEPDIALVLEGTTASDVTGIDEHKHATTVGEGPSLTFMDRASIPDPKLVSRLMKVAEKNGIPVQFRRNTAGGTDAGKIQLSKGGTSVATIALPCRYIHSPVSVMSKQDYDNALKLVKAFLKELEESGV